MNWPFVVFGLPRSRTAWMAHWLAGPGENALSRVGHDIAIGAASCQEFLDRLWHGRCGTVETAAIEGADLIRTAMPGAKFLCVHRSFAEIRASLTKFQLWTDEVEAELNKRFAALQGMKEVPRILASDLSDPVKCCNVWNYLRPDVPFSFDWWRHCESVNIQVDMQQRIRSLVDFGHHSIALSRDVEVRRGSVDPFVRVGWEPFDDMWPDAIPLTVRHDDESNKSHHGHPLDPNVLLISEMERCGSMKVVTARANGDLCGYLTWSFIPDVESQGITIAYQGAFFVDNDRKWAKLNLGRKMLKWSVASLRQAGFRHFQFHHTADGRGARLGSLFCDMGAQPYQQTYSLVVD
jgi:hypothetical protein